MKTTGVSGIPKFGLLDFLGHPIDQGDFDVKMVPSLPLIQFHQCSTFLPAVVEAEEAIYRVLLEKQFPRNFQLYCGSSNSKSFVRLHAEKPCKLVKWKWLASFELQALK